MMTLEEFTQAVDDCVQRLPPALFERLNGGVEVSPRAVPVSGSAPSEPRYTLGMYHRAHGMGCWITLYYGSFGRVFGHMDASLLLCEIEKVLRHELRHHMEDRAGVTDLIDEDRRRSREYALRHKDELREG